MKIHPLLLWAAALLLASAPLPAAEAPKLDTLLAEYKKARLDVLGKLNEAYAVRADALAKQYAAVPNLDGADRAQHFAKRLRDPDERNAAYGNTGTNSPTDPLTVLEADYAHARDENLANVYGFYSTAAGNLRRELLKTHDQAGADVLTTFLEKIKPAGATIAAQPSPAKSRSSASK